MKGESKYPVEAMQMSVLHVAQAPFGDCFFEFLALVCGIDETTYNGDIHDTLIAEGRRQVYLELKDALNAAYDNVGPGGVPLENDMPSNTLEAQDTMEDD